MKPYQFGLHDHSWTETEWQELLERLVENNVVTWKEIASLVLGHLNPPQVGTGLASSAGFQKRYGHGNTLRVVINWLYGQKGICTDCGTRLELQADHKIPREQFDDPLQADYIENIELRCRRCNVVRRPSHKYGGKTHLTAEAALMWILFEIRPRNFHDFVRLCRLYGLTMSDIRMQEAWAMAHWLPWYDIDDEVSHTYDLLCWPDNAITRRRTGERLPGDPQPIHQNVPATCVFGFVAQSSQDLLPRFYEIPVTEIPFSTYNLGARPRNDIAITYRAPDRNNGTGPRLLPMPPRGQNLLVHGLRQPHQRFKLTFYTPSNSRRSIVLEAPRNLAGRRIRGLEPQARITTLEAVSP